MEMVGQLCMEINIISSTLLDTFLTPAMFWLFGRKPAEALLDDKDAEAL